MSHAVVAEEAFQKAKKQIARKLEYAFELKNDPDKSFLPSGKAKDIIFESTLDDLRELCKTADDNDSEDEQNAKSTFSILTSKRNDQNTCLMLAVLICIGDFSLPQWRRVRDYFQQPLPDLPLDENAARGIFGPDLGQSFYDKQFAFCPVILRKKSLVVYVGTKSGCRMPYLEEAEVGKGLFGTVYKVKIPEKHVRGADSYYGPQTLARKDFEIGRGRSDFEREWETMRQVLQARHKDSNIMATFASLELGTSLGTKLSIFYRMAQCNLAQYLRNDNGMSTSTLHDIESPDHAKRYKAREKIFDQVKGLAKALETLHKFDTRDGKKLSCFHMDLKPENILVCLEENDSEVWKITDFGISRVETIESRLFKARTVLNLGELAVGRSFQASTTCRVTGPGGGGTYLAPEAMAEEAKVTDVCDVWSLACVIILVMAFAYGGPAEVKSLEDGLVAGEAGSDWFFVTEDPKRWSVTSKNTLKGPKENGEETLYKQNPKVEAYLNGLSFVHTDVSKDFYGKLTKLLLDKALVPNPRRRIDASEFSKTLQKQVEQHLKKEKIDGSLYRCNVRTPFDLQDAKITRTMLSSVTDFGLAGSVAFVSSDKVYVHETSYPHRSLQRLPSPTSEKSWLCCALSQDLLCIAVDSDKFGSDKFECQIIEMLPERIPIRANSDPRHIRANYGPIKMCAVSANSTLLAFVTRKNYGFRVHVFAKDDLYQPEDTRTNKLDGDCILEGCERVVRLQFSPDGRYLHAVFILRSAKDYGASVIIWNVVTGEQIATKRIPDRHGNSSHFDFVTSSQHVSMNSLTQQEPSVVFLTEGRYLEVIRVLSPKEKTFQDLGGAHRVLDFMVDESTHKVFFVARVGGTNFAKVFCAPFLPPSGEKLVWKDVTPSDASVPCDYNASTDSFYLRPWGLPNADGEAVNRNVVIATLGGFLLTFAPVNV